MTELKPCPFCGHSNFDMRDTLYPSGTTWHEHKEGYRVYGKPYKYENKCWQVVCGCGAELHADSKQEAITAWNRRVKDE